MGNQAKLRLARGLLVKPPKAYTAVLAGGNLFDDPPKPGMAHKYDLSLPNAPRPQKKRVAAVGQHTRHAIAFHLDQMDEPQELAQHREYDFDIRRIGACSASDLH